MLVVLVVLAEEEVVALQMALTLALVVLVVLGMHEFIAGKGIT